MKKIIVRPLVGIATIFAARVVAVQIKRAHEKHLIKKILNAPVTEES